jgi:hypothetical protein
VYLLIDGLDESRPRRDILNVLGKLRGPLFENLKILVMSREESEIAVVLKGFGNSVSLSSSGVNEDIKRFVQRQVRHHPRLRLYPEELQVKIETALVTRADGM